MDNEFVVRVAPRDHEPLGGAPFDDDGEPITALMVTGKDADHAGLARNSVVSFLAQSYPNRRLVIVNDGAYTFDLPGVPEGRVIQVNLDERRNLGELRNLSLEHVPPGGIWVQWDDDDWHHPSLLTAQYEKLREKNAEACFMVYQVKYAFELNAAWLDRDRYGFAGTIMARRREGIRYELPELGEDTLFREIYKERFDCRVWKNPPHYYLRFIHGHNSWDSEHFHLEEQMRNSRRRLRGKSRRYLEEIIGLYADIVQPDPA